MDPEDEIIQPTDLLPDEIQQAAAEDGIEE